MENEEKSMARGCLTLGLAGVALFALVIILLVFSGGKSDSGNAPAASSTPEATSMPIGDVVSTITTQINKQFEKSNVFVQDKIIAAQVWVSGTTESAMSATTDEALAEQWAEMIEGMRKTSKQTKDAIDKSGNTDYHIAYYLMNDQNDENFLVSTLDDTIMYDAVSGLNLLGVE